VEIGKIHKKLKEQWIETDEGLVELWKNLREFEGVVVIEDFGI
jgi:hypothetical protein